VPHAKAEGKGRVTYDVHPGVESVRKWIEALPQKTGRSLEEWMTLVRDSGLATPQERRDWLKNEHKLGTNAATWIVDRVEGKGAEDSDPEAYLKAAEGYVEAMFAGPKAGLRPIYEALLTRGRALGTDVKICPCTTIVPFFRRHVFAQIKPATRTRVDLGYALKDIKPLGRLLETGGFAKGDRITHRIPIGSVDEIDDEVKSWLKKAYDLDT
jgi:hypothetical protein